MGQIGSNGVAGPGTGPNTTLSSGSGQQTQTTMGSTN
jgi:hypothetical protein